MARGKRAKKDLQGKRAGSMSVKVAGQRGGEATRDAHGEEFYHEIGSLGGQARSKSQGNQGQSGQDQSEGQGDSNMSQDQGSQGGMGESQGQSEEQRQDKPS